MERIVSDKALQNFRSFLELDEKSEATVEKYLRDVRCFAAFIGSRTVDKALTIEYKTGLLKKYTVTSANSMIAALNAFLRFMGWTDCCIRQYRLQRQTYCSQDKELTRAEYIRLVNAAKRTGDRRLSLVLQTICGTGIRVSELQHITVESVERGEAVVSCKGKTRVIFIVSALRRQLLAYAKEQGTVAGPVFLSKNKKPLGRTGIWRDMKRLCTQAKVDPSKVFPHNLRHLFARIFYGIEKDIVKLADILGHSSINTTRIYIVSTGMEHKKRMEHMRLII